MDHVIAEARAEYRAELEEAHGQVWDTAQLMGEFWIVGVVGGYCLRVERRKDRRQGLIFVDARNCGRFYYDFIGHPV